MIDSFNKTFANYRPFMTNVAFNQVESQLKIKLSRHKMTTLVYGMTYKVR